MTDDRKWTDRYRTVAKIVVEAGLSPAIAFAFWVILGVMVLFATAEGKDSPMTAFFTAFGAVGQVGLAFAVYRLGQKQFEFAKFVAERQSRIESLPFKIAVYEKWLPLMRGLAFNPSQDKLGNLLLIELEVERVFSVRAAGAVNALSLAYADAVTLYEELQIGSKTFLAPGWANVNAEYRKKMENVRHLLGEAHGYLMGETKIDPKSQTDMV